MNLEQRLILLAQAIGTDIKTLRTAVGNLSNLTSTSKTDIVSAINESLVKSTANTSAIVSLVASLNGVQAAVSAINLTDLIDDAAGPSVQTRTLSAARIQNLVSTSIANLVGSSPSLLDTLTELAAAINNDPSFAAKIAESLGHRVRVDAAQSFTPEQQQRARSNIGAASIAEVTALQEANYDRDYVADYVAARNA